MFQVNAESSTATARADKESVRFSMFGRPAGWTPSSYDGPRMKSSPGD
jgi:hypothetical protein